MSAEQGKIQSFTDEELQRELERRKTSRLAQERAQRDARKARYNTKLTREVIDVVCPTHGRTSCSDANTCNADIRESTNSGRYVRCTRCYLLANLEAFDLDMRLTVTVEFEPSLEAKCTYCQGSRNSSGRCNANPFSDFCVYR